MYRIAGKISSQLSMKRPRGGRQGEAEDMSGRKNLKAVLAGGAGALALMTAGMAAAQSRD